MQTEFRSYTIEELRELAQSEEPTDVGIILDEHDFLAGLVGTNAFPSQEKPE